jgi:hypothetical protein
MLSNRLLNYFLCARPNCLKKGERLRTREGALSPDGFSRSFQYYLQALGTAHLAGAGLWHLGFGAAQVALGT